MMKLTTFEKINTETKTEYTVFKKYDKTKGFQESDFVSTFEVNYLAEAEQLNKALTKLKELKKQGATVKHVRVNSHTHILTVTIILNQEAAI